MFRILVVFIAIFLLSRIGVTTEGEAASPPQEPVRQSEQLEPVLYSKGGTLLAFISRDGSKLADMLKEDQWVHNARNDDACYRFILYFNAKEGMYSLLGGPMKDRTLVYSSNPEEVLNWLHALEDLKCNRVRA